VIAANAPADIVRCVGREGESYLDQLAAAQREQLPDAPFVDTPDYRRKFFDTIGSGHGGDTDSDKMNKRIENSYKAQLLRDNTMAASILAALKRYPGHQVLHINGTFHSEHSLGTVAALLARAPELEVRIISPVMKDDTAIPLSESELALGDTVYILRPLPTEYMDTDRQIESLSKQFKNAHAKSCGLGT
jgi:uncharacterized iron-regulated protein